jgi:protein phosphatase
MSNPSPEPSPKDASAGSIPPSQGGLLSGVKSLFEPAPAKDNGEEEVMPSWDVPMALPVEGPVGEAPTAIPVALPVSAPLPPSPEPYLAGGAGAVPAVPVAQPVDTPVAEVPPPAAVPAAPAGPATFACPVCTSTNPVGQAYCSDCGYNFSPADVAAATKPRPAADGAGAGEVPAAAPPEPRPPAVVGGRYELKELVSERHGVQRFRGVDLGEGGNGPSRPVVVVRQPLPPALPVPEPAEGDPGDSDEVLPSFDDVATDFPQTAIHAGQAAWPGVAWERKLLQTLDNPALPAELAHFSDETHEYLVEEVPAGQSLWDAWDDPDASSYQKFGYLAEVAQTLDRLHQGGAMLEGLRPDIVVVGDDGHARVTSLADLLPLPLPADAAVRGGPYTAPELLSGKGNVDARADLYSFGAMLYALTVGRELNERTDFDGPGNPKPYIPRFPDVHPAFGRLMMKTFRKEVEARFPTDEASREDATGFTELVRTLEVLRRTYDNVRLEIASWTSTGIVRTGNEDAFALMHACESRQDDLGEAALVLLCDGMGGYEAGEVAAALTIQVLRQQLSALKPFNTATGASPFATDPLKEMSKAEGHAGPLLDVSAARAALKAALKEANKQVFQASRAPGSKRRGMGCTAEAVYVDGRNVVVGHVGDSRTYHLHEGRLIQLTRDQTLVNRLVELGSLTPEEAETHPRRNELQQAVGGQPDVEPGLYHGRLSPGDWVVVCSDGLTNHVSARDLQQMLQSEASSAEMAARRLVNLTLIEGATDNVTVVVIRAT